MRNCFLFVILLGCVAQIPMLAQNCQTASSVPGDQPKVGSGSVTSDYDGTTKFKGGQAVYVRITNANVLGVSYELTIAQDTTPVVTVCTYKAVLPPKASAVLWGALFAEPPIGWKVTVAIGSESDAGVLTYEVYSKTK
jgi:hypothetical protein